VFYQSHLSAIHALLRAEPLARKYLSGFGIILAGKPLGLDQIVEVMGHRLSSLEFAHLFSIFNDSRVHGQREDSQASSQMPAAFYFTTVNPVCIQAPFKIKLGLFHGPGSSGSFVKGLHIHRYFLNAAVSGQGLGSIAFGLCAINAHLMGLEDIQLIAAGGVGYPKRQYGFKVWPKLGFDAPLDPDEINGHPQLTSCRTVQDVLEIDADWWDRHGSSRLMIFDLRANSASWLKLLGYLHRKLPLGAQHV
jgi:hypothetical protein